MRPVACVMAWPFSLFSLISPSTSSSGNYITRSIQQMRSCSLLAGNIYNMKFTNRINLAELKYVPTTRLTLASSYLNDIYSGYEERIASHSPEQNNGQPSKQHKLASQAQQEIHQTAKKYSLGKTQLSPDSMTDRKQSRVERRKRQQLARQQQKQVSAFQHKVSRMELPKGPSIQQHRVYKSKYLQEKDKKQNQQSQKGSFKKLEGKRSSEKQEIITNQFGQNRIYQSYFHKRTSEGANDRFMYFDFHQTKPNYEASTFRASSDFIQNPKNQEHSESSRKQFKTDHKELETSDSYLSNKKSIQSEGKMSLRKSIYEEPPLAIERQQDFKNDRAYLKSSQTPSVEQQMNTLKELRQKLVRIKNQNNIRKEALFKSVNCQTGLQNNPGHGHKSNLKELQVQKIRRQIREAIECELHGQSVRQKRTARR